MLTNKSSLLPQSVVNAARPTQKLAREHGA